MAETQKELPPLKENVNKQTNLSQAQEYSSLSLFRFADGQDVVMMFIGTLGSFGSGAAIPLFIYFLVAFNEAYIKQNVDDLLDQAQSLFLQIIYMGFGTFVSGWIMRTFWLISGERQVTKCRKQYLQSIIKQQIGYFDCIDQSQLSAKFSMDMLVFQEALGQKMGLALQIVGCFISTLIIAYSRGWLLALVMTASIVMIITCSYFNIIALQQKQKKFLQIYTQAGGKAQEVLASIKTVKQLNGQDYQRGSYQNSLRQTSLNLMKYCFKIALCYGLMQASIFIVYYIGLWQGSNCVEGNSHCPLTIIKNTYSMRDAITIFFCFQTSCFTFSQLFPALKKIGEAKVAAQRIFQIIDRVPKVRNPENGLKPEQFQGYFQLKNVTFAYPKNKSAIILNNISIKFDILRTALVGDSGCGKSTILQLLMRFYDPDKGSILLDGIDIRQIDLYWLRRKIGYVGQEPILFSGSIRDNLLMGNSNATSQEIDDALKQAEAYQFVYKQLDQKLETFVGAGGGQISGGQKQRIAIARALLKRPKILLLDEATSALDRRNEKIIQDTFDKISQKLTTITVAHRIKTIINSNVIFVINQGSVQQSGSFEKLKKYQCYEQKSEQQEQELTIQCPSLNEPEKIKNLISECTERVIVIRPQSEALKSKKIVVNNEQQVDRPWSEIFSRIFTYNKDQRCYFIIAIIVSILVGLLHPTFSIYLPRMIVALKDLQARSPTGRADANRSALAFVILAAVSFVVCFLQSFLGNIVANQISTKLRLETFKKFLKMPVKWFDKPDNSSGILSSTLTKDCQIINGVTSTFIFVLLQTLTSVIAGFTIAFVYEWRITLVAIGLIPLIALGGAVRNYFRIGLFKKIQIVHKGSEEMIQESLINIRTVISLNAEENITSKYFQELQSSFKIVVRTGIIAGLMNGLAMILMYSIFGALLYIGAVFTANYNVSLGDLLTGIFQCFFVGFILGNNMQYLPDMSAAKISAIKIFNILDQEDEEQIQIKENSKMLKEGINGDIKFENIYFQYEGRGTKVFEGLNFQIKKGEKVAFVGPSGCGKSTIIQLLQRFYFPQKGNITIGGIDIRDFDIHALRSKFGVVSQQPTLFSRSFEENIRYNTEASKEQMRNATKNSNALSFIEGDQKIDAQNEEQSKNNNERFNRLVGVKGLHISGGQKQRVAIARAILRNPQILLLDEATSALDAQNEEKIQQCLDGLMNNKTTITVAHRFETIKNSDKINVLEAGHIVEQGNYEDLINQKGYFYNLSKGLTTDK